MDGRSQMPAARQGTTTITCLLDAHNMLSNQVRAHEKDRAAVTFSNSATKIRTYSFLHAFDRFLSHLHAPQYGTLHFIFCRVSRLNAVVRVPSCASFMGVLSIVLAVQNSAGVESSLPFCVLPSRLLSVSIHTKMCSSERLLSMPFAFSCPPASCVYIKRKAILVLRSLLIVKIVCLQKSFDAHPANLAMHSLLRSS